MCSSHYAPPKTSRSVGRLLGRGQPAPERSRNRPTLAPLAPLDGCRATWVRGQRRVDTGSIRGFELGWMWGRLGVVLGCIPGGTQANLRFLDVFLGGLSMGESMFDQPVSGPKKGRAVLGIGSEEQATLSCCARGAPCSSEWEWDRMPSSHTEPWAWQPSKKRMRMAWLTFRQQMPPCVSTIATPLDLQENTSFTQNHGSRMHFRAQTLHSGRLNKLSLGI